MKNQVKKTNKSIWCLFVTCFICLLGCKKSNDEKIVTEGVPNQVVLIIDHCPNYSAYLNPETEVYSSKANDYEITAINSDLISLSYKTKAIPERDTVVFPTNGEILEIDHIYKFHRYISFRVQKGDTVLFTYENDFPEATILNREVSDKDINYEKVRNEFVIEGENFDGNSKFNMHPVSSIKGYIKIRDRLKSKEIRLEAYESALEKSQKELEKEVILLDSLFKMGEISEETMSYYKARSYVLYEFNKHTYSDYVSKNFGDKEASLNKWNFQEAQDLELAGYGYYSRILNQVVRQEYYESVNWIEEVNIRFPDYRQLYDLIRENDFLSSKDMEILLAENIKQIIEHFNEKDINAYLNKFIKDVKNPELLKGILGQHQYALSADLKNWYSRNISLVQTFDSLMNLNLIDLNNNELNFLDLMEANKGKLIYVDFWASHCVPCYVAMPYSKKLKSSYQDGEVVFLYISIDTEYDKWVRGMDKAQIKDYPLSFMVDRGKSNNLFLQTMSINEIPRYILFDKDGELIHYRAYGPSTNEIYETIRNHMK